MAPTAYYFYTAVSESFLPGNMLRLSTYAIWVIVFTCLLSWFVVINRVWLVDEHVVFGSVVGGGGFRFTYYI